MCQTLCLLFPYHVAHSARVFEEEGAASPFLYVAGDAGHGEFVALIRGAV